MPSEATWGVRNTESCRHRLPVQDHTPIHLGHEKQLNYHAWSASPTDSNSFWANQQSLQGASKEFWGRGSGWYFAALVDVLELMPKEHVDYKALQDIYTQVALGLQRWQDKKSGCWFQLLQYDETTTADGLGDLVNGRRYNI